MKINILIVDDIKENLYALEILLEELEIDDDNFEGLNLLKALNGEEALRLAFKENIDLILLDVKMPTMDGFEVAEFLKSTTKTANIPIIFLTAEFKSNDFINRGYKVGALDYFAKPIEKFQFLNKIKLYVTLFLSKKKQKQEFDNTLHEYVELIDKYIISSDTDLDGKITRVSQAFCNTSGYSREELLGNTHNIIRCPEVSDEFYKQIWNTLSQDKVWEGQIKNKKKNNTYYWVEASISPRYDSKGNKIGYTSIKQDITNKKKLEKISITDALTEIFNRRYFNEIIPKVINTLKRRNELICFAVMDVDYFKFYNDTYGHQMGDEVLKKIAKVLRNSTHRADDYCFRIGGEEFCVVFRAEDKMKAFNFISKMKEDIENLEIENIKSDASKYVTISVGLTCIEAKKVENLNSLFNETDKLLYLAKKRGKNIIITN